MVYCYVENVRADVLGRLCFCKHVCGNIRHRISCVLIVTKDYAQNGQNKKLKTKKMKRRNTNYDSRARTIPNDGEKMAIYLLKCFRRNVPTGYFFF